jgi:hypothetical protein
MARQHRSSAQPSAPAQPPKPKPDGRPTRRRTWSSARGSRPATTGATATTHHHGSAGRRGGGQRGEDSSTASPGSAPAVARTHNLHCSFRAGPLHGLRVLYLTAPVQRHWRAAALRKRDVTRASLDVGACASGVRALRHAQGQPKRPALRARDGAAGVKGSTHTRAGWPPAGAGCTPRAVRPGSARCWPARRRCRPSSPAPRR